MTTVWEIVMATGDRFYADERPTFRVVGGAASAPVSVIDAKEAQSAAHAARRLGGSASRVSLEANPQHVAFVVVHELDD